MPPRRTNRRSTTRPPSASGARSSSLPRPTHPTVPHPDQYPEAEIGIITKAPRPSRSKTKTKTPSRRHEDRPQDRPRPGRLVEAVREAVAEAVADVLLEAKAGEEDVQEQIENLLGLAEGTGLTERGVPGSRRGGVFC